MRLLNAHRILVVPSRYDEPFGIVALEGIACGCVVVGSRGAASRRRSAPAALTFRNGDAGELAACSAAACGRSRTASPPRPRRRAGATSPATPAGAIGGAYLRVIDRGQGRRREVAA